eukprot:m.211479 g.211479  ORF g.211479 m.211479 type:complete len:397 (+) comp18383_c0_seq1:147-1337(+)
MNTHRELNQVGQRQADCEKIWKCAVVSERRAGSSVAEVCRLEVVVVDGGVDVALVAQKVQRLADLSLVSHAAELVLQRRHANTKVVRGRLDDPQHRILLPRKAVRRGGVVCAGAVGRAVDSHLRALGLDRGGPLVKHGVFGAARADEVCVDDLQHVVGDLVEVGDRLDAVHCDLALAVEDRRIAIGVHIHPFPAVRAHAGVELVVLHAVDPHHHLQHACMVLDAEVDLSRFGLHLADNANNGDAAQRHAVDEEGVVRAGLLRCVELVDGQRRHRRVGPSTLLLVAALAVGGRATVHEAAMSAVLVVHDVASRKHLQGPKHSVWCWWKRWLPRLSLLAGSQNLLPQRQEKRRSKRKEVFSFGAKKIVVWGPVSLSSSTQTSGIVRTRRQDTLKNAVK